MEEAMDIKHTEFTASSKKIEISNDSGSVNIVRENVQVNIVNSKSAAEPPVDEMLSEEVFLTEAALVEPAPEKPFQETALPFAIVARMLSADDGCHHFIPSSTAVLLFPHVFPGFLH